MAYDANILDEEKKTQGMSVVGANNQLQQQPMPSQDVSQQQQAPAQRSGESATIQAGTQPRVQSRKTPSSGMFTNVKQYIDANRGQAAKLAQSATGTLGSEASAVKAAVDKSKSDYLSKAQDIKQQQRQKYDQYQGAIQQAAKTGELDPTKLTRFKQYMGEDYQYQPGGMNLHEAGQRLQDIKKLEASGSTEAGRRDLLTKAFGRDNRRYTRGQQALDQLILQNTGEGFKGLAKGLQQGREAAEASVSSAKQAEAEQRQTLQNQRAEYLKRLQDQLTSATTGLETELSGILAKRQAEQARYRDLLSGQVDGGFREFKQLVSPEERAQMLSEVSKAKEAISKAGLGAYEALKGGVDLEALGYLGEGERITSSGPEKTWRIGDPNRSDPRELVGEFLKEEDFQDWVRKQQRTKLLPELQKASASISDRDLASLGMTRADLENQIQQSIAGDFDYEKAAQSLSSLAGGIDTSESALLENLYGSIRGMSPSEREMISQFYTMPELTQQSIASADQAARLSALQQLAGIDPTISKLKAKDMQAIRDFDASELRRALLNRASGRIA